MPTTTTTTMRKEQANTMQPFFAGQSQSRIVPSFSEQDNTLPKW